MNAAAGGGRGGVNDVVAGSGAGGAGHPALKPVTPEAPPPDPALEEYLAYVEFERTLSPNTVANASRCGIGESLMACLCQAPPRRLSISQ